MKKAATLVALLLGSTATVLAATHYVDLNNATPSAPYTSWATAATNIEDAVDAAASGETVLVADGLYLLGSEITVTNDITVESVNGLDAATVDGGGMARCFNLGSNTCSVIGFTIANGYSDDLGGGIYCDDKTPVVSNCVVAGNSSGFYGGGMAGGTAYGCTFTNNSAYVEGGGLIYGDAFNCTFTDNYADVGAGMNSGTASNCVFTGNAGSSGGGLYSGNAYHCTFEGNFAGSDGGGMSSGKAYHCIFNGNHADEGGGAYFSMYFDGAAYNCLFIHNTADSGGGTYQGDIYSCTFASNSARYGGGGMSGGYAKNCIVWHNSSDSGATNIASAAADNTCSPDVWQHGINGNTTNAPLFADLLGGDYRLVSGSPCIDAGDNAGVSWPADLDGNARIANGTVDMGAYEFTAGSSGVAITNWAVVASGFMVEWVPVPGSDSVVAWSSNLVSTAFTNLSGVLPYPQGSYTDTVHGAESAKFYQIEIQ